MAETDAANADQIAYWNTTAGATWSALQEKLDGQIQPLGTAPMAALALKPGERVIDIGCGCGQTTLALAAEVGPAGSVLGVDVSAPMLAVARRRIAAAGLTQGSVTQADAQTHPFAPAAADAVFSRFGVMFFEDPPAAFANIRTGLKPGGRLAFVCWRPFAENPWMSAPLAAAQPLLPEPTTPPPDPLAPGPFAFADPDRVRAILTGAGFTDIALTPQDKPIGSPDLDQAVETALKVGPLGGRLREAPHLTGAVIAAVREALAAHTTPQGVRLASATWLVTARRP